jgi:hypothetical protein
MKHYCRLIQMAVVTRTILSRKSVFYGRYRRHICVSGCHMGEPNTIVVHLIELFRAGKSDLLPARQSFGHDASVPPPFRWGIFVIKFFSNSSDTIVNSQCICLLLHSSDISETRPLGLRADRPLPPGKFPVLISVRDSVDPRAIVRLERLGQLKNPMISAETEPTTFRLVS